MRKISVLMMFFVLFLLTACGPDVLSTEETEFEVIRGGQFTEPVLFLNDEENIDFEITTDLDVNVVGDYTMTYTVGELTHTITITVVPNDFDYYIEALDATQAATSVEMNESMDLRYEQYGSEKSIERETYLKVYNEFAYVEMTSKQGFAPEQVLKMYMEEVSDTSVKTYVSTDGTCYVNMGLSDIEEDDTFLGWGINLWEATLLDTTKETDKTVYHVQVDLDDAEELIEYELTTLSVLDSNVEFVLVDVTVEDGIVTALKVDLTDVSENLFEVLEMPLDTFVLEMTIENVDNVEAFDIPIGIAVMPCN